MSRLLLIAVLVVVSGCGGSPTTPSAIPSPTASTTATADPPQAAPLPGNVTAWTGPRTLTSVTRGECVGPVLAASIGSVSAYDLRVTQNGTTLTAVATDRKTGFTMKYTGTAEGPLMSLAPAKEFYQPGTLPLTDFACGGGQLRDLELNTSTITATISGNTLTGTVVDHFYVDVAWMVGNTRHYSYVTNLVLTSSFVLTR